MGNIFYASSWGGTATSWLAKVLSIHEDLQCYHGTRHFEDSGNTEELTCLDFAKGLKARAKNGLWVGGIHGYHGSHMEKPISDLGGSFGFLTRDPIQRISSLFNHHLSESQKPQNHHNYKIMLDQFSRVNADMIQYLVSLNCFPNIAENEQISTTDMELLFTWNVGHAMHFEASILASKAETFKMEDYTTDPEHFKTLFNYFTQGYLTCSQDYLDQVFAVGKTNTHRIERASSLAEFYSWNKHNKMIFYVIMKCNAGLVDYYDAIGYPAIKQILNKIDGHQV
ncbi:MAG: hypothetical protein HQL69_01510 [Magnetococcales bacterium]|nr:hypothetical protein [Magnetococcales bacterium]